MKNLAYFFFLLLVWSCKDELIKKPEPFLDESEMVRLMIDLQLADSQVIQLHINSTDSAVLVYLHLEEQIFKKKQIDSTIYRSNYRYYLQDLKAFKSITQAVYDSLQKRETEAAKAPQEQPKPPISTPKGKPSPPNSVPTSRPMPPNSIPNHRPTPK